MVPYLYLYVARNLQRYHVHQTELYIRCTVFHTYCYLCIYLSIYLTLFNLPRPTAATATTA